MAAVRPARQCHSSLSGGRGLADALPSLGPAISALRRRWAAAASQPADPLAAAAIPALEHAVLAYALLWPTHAPARIAVHNTRCLIMQRLQPAQRTFGTIIIVESLVAGPFPPMTRAGGCSFKGRSPTSRRGYCSIVVRCMHNGCQRSIAPPATIRSTPFRLLIEVSILYSIYSIWFAPTHDRSA